EEEDEVMRTLHLLTSKPVMYVANVAEDELKDAIESPESHPLVQEAYQVANAEGAEVVVVSARIEAELAELPPEEKAAFLADLGLTEPGLNRVIRTGFRLLGLISYFTAGVKEVRSWTISRGTKAPQAAG